MAMRDFLSLILPANLESQKPTYFLEVVLFWVNASSIFIGRDDQAGEHFQMWLIDDAVFVNGGSCGFAHAQPQAKQAQDVGVTTQGQVWLEEGCHCSGASTWGNHASHADHRPSLSVCLMLFTRIRRQMQHRLMRPRKKKV